MTSITQRPAGKLADGRVVNLVTIANGRIEVSLLELGVRATAVKLAGLPHNLILGYPTLNDYETDRVSMGAVVGRYANRIRDGRFELDGRPIQLTLNRGSYHLHGGVRGFAQRLWRSEHIDDGARFTLESHAGEEGYPGNLEVTLEVRVMGDLVEYRYQAVSDADTVVNLTNHTYFNLDASPDILRHRLTLPADRYLAIDAESLPTGEMLPVAASPFDFREAKSLGRDIDRPDPQLRFGAGYDHCYVLPADPEGPAMRPVAWLEGETASMTVFTTEPGIQLYTGNYLPAPRAAVCLETQHFPDSPNQPHFPSTRLRAGETYSSISRYQFEAV